MQIFGKVVDIEWDVEIQKNGGGSYIGTSLTYKDNQGKVQTKAWVKKVLDHAANATVKATLQSLTKGNNFEAEAVKNDAGFWNWVQLKIVFEGAQQTATPSNTTPQRSTWNGETPEERAERRALDKLKFEFEKEKQGLIIKQSSLSNAVAFLGKAGKDVSTGEVISVAKEFEAYVLGIEIE